MPDFEYLIVGGGLTVDAAVKGIRQVGPTGAIGLLGEELDPPYSRPPLSKALWKGEPLDSIWRKTRHDSIETHLGRTIKEVVPKESVSWTTRETFSFTGNCCSPRAGRLDAFRLMTTR